MSIIILLFDTLSILFWFLEQTNQVISIFKILMFTLFYNYPCYITEKCLNKNEWAEDTFHSLSFIMFINQYNSYTTLIYCEHNLHIHLKVPFHKTTFFQCQLSDNGTRLFQTFPGRYNYFYVRVALQCRELDGSI